MQTIKTLRIRVRVGFSKVFYMVSENRAFHHSSHKNSGSVWRVRRKIIYILSHELRSGSVRKHVISNQYHFMHSLDFRLVFCNVYIPVNLWFVLINLIKIGNDLWKYRSLLECFHFQFDQSLQESLIDSKLYLPSVSKSVVSDPQ